MFKYILNKILKKLRGSAILDSNIHNTAKVESGSTIVNSTFQSHSFCGYDCTLIHVSVGKFCSIASRVTIGGAAHPMHFVSTSPVFLSHKDSVKAKFAHHDYLPMITTHIGHDVWIGEGAFVKAGVNIGTGAVIGMGSVVTKDVAPYSVVGGNPAKHIRYRFDERMINALLESKWWDFSDISLNKYGAYFNNPEDFIRHNQGEKN